MTDIKQFTATIDAYFAQCDDENVYPDEAGLVLTLGMSPREYRALLADTDDATQPHRDALETAKMRRDSILERRQFAEGKGAMFSTRAPTRDDAPPPKVEVVFRGEDEFYE
ncbi:MAG: hypothetical protein LBN02_09055 [Oscillospiraceae bacterium]|jgi:hypothetical protein|nr:hypothetical protein [Oscillospiraceae bacterium]